MPLLLRRHLGANAELGIWQLTESESDLIQHFPETAHLPTSPESITHPIRRAQWLATRVLLAQLHQKAEINYDSNGKPWINAPGKHISISHSGDLIALLLDKNPTGIDIEKISPKIERIANKFLQPDEVIDAQSELMPDKMYVYWCVKEAIYKVNGDKGVSMKLNISVEPFTFAETGTVRAAVHFGEKHLSRILQYEQIDGFMLAYTLSDHV